MSGSAFDAIAARYDAEFTDRRLGHLLRAQVRRFLERTFEPGQRVLDLGCGTGEDAVWMAGRGLRVTAVDASPAMLAMARAKAARERADDRITYRQADLSAARLELGDEVAEPCFDGAYSNFGALNCIAERAALAAELARLVRPRGRVLLVVMGPFCAWETVGHLCCGRVKTAFRRLRRRPRAQLAGGESFPVYYPSVRRLRRDFEPWFRLSGAFGVGLLLPPSEFHGLVARRPRLSAAMAAFDRRFADGFPATWLSDHHLTIFERR